jgi:hypothetical protein
MRSAISNADDPADPAYGSAGPEPPASVEATAPLETELNATDRGADTGGTLVPAAAGVC